MNNLHVGYECLWCHRMEFLSIDPQDIVYSDDAMIELGWLTDGQGRWLCPHCETEEGRNACNN